MKKSDRFGGSKRGGRGGRGGGRRDRRGGHKRKSNRG